MKTENMPETAAIAVTSPVVVIPVEQFMAGQKEGPRRRNSDWMPAEPRTEERRGRRKAKKTAAPRPRKRKQSRSKETKHVTTSPQRAASSNDSKGRGRIAGRYIPGDKEPTKFLTNSIVAVHKMVKRHKRGLTASAIAERLKMPMGTVGWALQHLKRQSAVGYQPVETAVA